MFRSDFAVLRQVAPRLPHHPYGQPWNRFAPCGAKKQLLAGQCWGFVRHNSCRDRITNLLGSRFARKVIRQTQKSTARAFRVTRTYAPERKILLQLRMRSQWKIPATTLY